MAKASTKTKTKSDFVGKTDDQLSENLGELKREQFNLRFPGGDEPARKAEPRARGPQGYRPHQNHAGAALRCRREVRKSTCQSAC